MNITTTGLDLAKSVFHVVCFNNQFKEVKKRMLRRSQVLQFLTNYHLVWSPWKPVQAPITGEGNCVLWVMT